MTTRIFISSVQKEFAQERKALADYLRKVIEPLRKTQGSFRLMSHVKTASGMP